MGAIDEVKQKIDILEVVGQYVKLQKSGRTFRGLCPFHEEKHGSFFVYPERQSWHCFGACGTGGDVFSFIMKKEGIDFGEALRQLAEKAGVTLPDRTQAEARAKENDRLYQANKDAAHYYNELLLHSDTAAKAKEYALKRGLTLKTIMDFEIGYAGSTWEGLREHLRLRNYSDDELLKAGLVIKTDDGKILDRFRSKLMFPIWDERGRVIGFGARVLDNSEPKYINSPQTALFDKSGTLYAIGKAIPSIRKSDTTVIVEGYMDVLVAHQYGFTNVVASMGTALNEKHINMIRKLSKNVVMALDPDVAGEEASLRARKMIVSTQSADTGIIPLRDSRVPIPLLDNKQFIQDQERPRIHVLLSSAEIDAKVAILPNGKDPDEVIKENPTNWQQIIDSAIPIVEYAFHSVVSELDLTKVKDKDLAVERLLPVIAEIGNPVRYSHYLQKLASLIKVDPGRLENSLKRIVSAQRGRHKLQTNIIKTRKLLSSPLEEYSLALIIKHPELKEFTAEILPEYFENSENREIFVAWQRAGSDGLRDEIPPEICEHFDEIISRESPEERTDEKLAGCILRLREKFVRSLEAEKGAILATEAETGGAEASLAKFTEQGTAGSEELKKIFLKKSRRPTGQRR